MKIERDAAEVTAGVRHGRTLGGPIALPGRQPRLRQLGGADEPVAGRGRRCPRCTCRAPATPTSPGVQKYGFTDVRNVLERASARETAARVAGGALAKAFLRALGVEVVSHVTQIGSVQRAASATASRSSDFADVDESPVRCLDADALAGDGRGDQRAAQGATSRSAASSRCAPSGSCPGLGSHVSWEERLDGRIGAGDALDPGDQGRRDRRRLRPRRAARARRPTTRSSTTRSAATTARPTAPAGSRAA